MTATALAPAVAAGVRPPRVRTGLWLLLGAVTLISAAAMYWPMDVVDVVAPRVPADRRAGEVEVAMASESASAASAAQANAAPTLGPARFDPFTGVAAVPAAPAPRRVAAPAPAAPALLAPPLQHHYLGRFSAPDGQILTLLARGDAMVVVTPGLVLEGGYKVERVDERGVHVSHAATGVKTMIAIPLAEAATPVATVATNPR